jgi:hypothetical protein
MSAWNGIMLLLFKVEEGQNHTFGWKIMGTVFWDAKGCILG